MIESILNVQIRKHTGKQYAKQLRRSGKVPGIFYTHGEDSIPIIVDEKELHKVVFAEVNLIELSFGNKKSRKCILRDVQFDPVHGNILHVDLMGIKLSEKITVTIPVHVVGTPVGVKDGGGILHQDMREIEIEGLPLELPEHIEIDVSMLKIGDTITVGDIAVEKGTILTDPEKNVITVRPPKIVVEAPKEVTEAVTEPESAEDKAKKEEVAEQKEKE